jgi:hypothetical protein
MLVDGRHRQYCSACHCYPFEIKWPTFKRDPLWMAFRQGGDPYNALLTALDPDGHTESIANGNEKQWLEDNRWRGKKAFLALAYGSQAESLAPGLKWTVERTKLAIQNLESVYATLRPLRELTLLRMIHLGMVRNLWGRPASNQWLFPIAGVEPVTVRFA